MGIEVNTQTFSIEDEREFQKKLREETELLLQWFKNKTFEKFEMPSCGLELEGWLVDENYFPNPIAQKFLSDAKNPLVVPEISQFNFELNADPHLLNGKVFSTLHNNLRNLWSHCQKTANKLGSKTLMIGSLPTLKKEMLTLDYIYPNKRYFALNDQILKFRQEKPIPINIRGKEELNTTFNNVMLEAAATSFQIHIQIPLEKAVEFYNASILLSPFCVALSANSPFLFGKTLWSETRVPIFEQSICLEDYTGQEGKIAKRVCLGNNFIQDSLFELFIDNLDTYDVLLPAVGWKIPEKMEHVRLHNGTIWRWNRPIIGFNDQGVPHLRIEHRVQSSGPTPSDMIANMAFYLGAVTALANNWESFAKDIKYDEVCSFFYAACEKGLNAEFNWKGKKQFLQEILANDLIDLAYNELQSLGIDQKDLEFYFQDILVPRVRSGQTASNWQRAFVNINGHRYQDLLEKYFEYQEKDLPVHLWRF